MPKYTEELTPYWQTTDGTTVRLYHGHVVDVLARLPARSVQCVVTSPPYWGLRDYNVVGQIGSEQRPDCLGWARGINCAEQDWDAACHVCRMVLMFRQVRRVLRDDGVCWLNYGDTYSNSGGHTKQGNTSQRQGRANVDAQLKMKGIIPDGIPVGNLVGVPWRVALALQADGWALRQDIVWEKPSPMPESVRNRCTKAHEYIFLLAKSNRYYYDAEAIKEGAIQAGRVRADKVGGDKGDAVNHSPGFVFEGANKRNKRSVWTVSSSPYPGAHYATFPPKLIEPCILAGTSAKGACAACGAPWKRVVEEKKLTRSRPNEYVKRNGEAGTGNSCANTVAGVEVKTVGWYPTCNCHLEESRCKQCGADWSVVEAGSDYKPPVVEPGVRNVDESRRDKVRKIDGKSEAWRAAYSRPTVVGEPPCDCLAAHVVPCTVMDIFVGSGTTCCVAYEHGRRSIGIDLSEAYLEQNAVPRITGKMWELWPRKAQALVPKRDKVNVAKPEDLSEVAKPTVGVDLFG